MEPPGPVCAREEASDEIELIEAKESDRDRSLLRRNLRKNPTFSLRTLPGVAMGDGEGEPGCLALEGARWDAEDAVDPLRLRVIIGVHMPPPPPCSRAGVPLRDPSLPMLVLLA